MRIYMPLDPTYWYRMAQRRPNDISKILSAFNSFQDAVNQKLYAKNRNKPNQNMSQRLTENTGTSCAGTKRGSRSQDEKLHAPQARSL